VLPRLVPGLDLLVSPDIKKIRTESSVTRATTCLQGCSQVASLDRGGAHWHDNLAQLLSATDTGRLTFPSTMSERVVAQKISTAWISFPGAKFSSRSARLRGGGG
jgi:hypothetical protein